MNPDPLPSTQGQVELLPCPFCGSSHSNLLLPTCRPETPYNAADRLYPVVRCSQCYAEATGKNEDYKGGSAIQRWNQRATSSVGRGNDAGATPVSRNPPPSSGDWEEIAREMEQKFEVGDQWFYRGNRSPRWFFLDGRGKGQSPSSLADMVPIAWWFLLEEIAKLKLILSAIAKSHQPKDLSSGKEAGVDGCAPCESADLMPRDGNDLDSRDTNSPAQNLSSHQQEKQE